MILRILALPFLVLGVSALIFGAAAWQIAKGFYRFTRMTVGAAVTWLCTGETA